MIALQDEGERDGRSGNDRGPEVELRPGETREFRDALSDGVVSMVFLAAAVALGAVFSLRLLWILVTDPGKADADAFADAAREAGPLLAILAVLYGFLGVVLRIRLRMFFSPGATEDDDEDLEDVEFPKD